MAQHTEFPNSGAEASNNFGHSCMALFEGFSLGFCVFLVYKSLQKNIINPSVLQITLS